MRSHSLQFELNRLIKEKWYIIFFLIFFMMGIFLVYSNSEKLQIFQKEKFSFMTAHLDKGVLNGTSPNSWNGEFQVLLAPSPLVVFFAGWSVFEDARTMVDANGDNLTVNNGFANGYLPRGGKNISDIAGLFFLLGSLFMGFMGVTSYTSEKYFFNFKNVILRLTILGFFFLVPTVCLFFFASLMGLNVSLGESWVFFGFCLYLLVYLSFFYSAGVFIRVVSGSIRASHLHLIIFWVVSVLIMPPFMAILLQKQSFGLPTTGKSEYSSHRQWDKGDKREIQLRLDRYEMPLIFYPTSFYHFLSVEISGRGFQDIILLMDHTTTVQLERQKQFQPSASRLVFHSTARLPKRFTLALLIAVFYSCMLLTASFFLIRRKGLFTPFFTFPDYKFEAGFSYFVLCKDETYRDAFFRYYQSQGNWGCLDNASGEELDPGAPLYQTAVYFIQQAGVDPTVVQQHLQVLGVEMDSLSSRRHYTKKEYEAIIIKLYVAITMASNKEVIVVNDFLKGKSPDLEHRFLNLVNLLNRTGKIIIFLSCDFFQTALPFEKEIHIHSYRSFKIDPRAVRLR